MDVAVLGAHGQIARHLTQRLARRGDRVRGLVRNTDHHEDVRADGADPVTHDVEHDPVDALVEHVRGAHAVVFAAGAGPGSGAARKETVDYGGAAALLEAAGEAPVDRYVMISAMGTDDPPGDDEVFSVYLRAKARADEELMASDLEWTVVRPGRLTDEPATGLVTLDRHVERGAIPRADVAEVVVACLDEPRTAGHVFEVVGGETPIDDALDALVRGG
ncbi:SDR family oxidoreductase [Egibacter rhizosphaerae]|uniref:SDR family oxidoreductase n=1 Tax=Egibacter rhizosphaerae TaxID=1670831 RepID=A0A411YHB5_9ACTN|nr:SDR family oxidoreductase [Egibacter rhizosphaerae]QBI20630.1 SDR family oxidoreductase [Egibacter rhizosphaerae]